MPMRLSSPNSLTSVPTFGSHPSDASPVKTLVTLDAFEKTVLGSARPVLVKFSTPTCSWCKTVQPDVEAFARIHVGELDVVEVVLDRQKDLPLVEFAKTHYDIDRRGVPTFSFFTNGVEKGEIICTRDVVDNLISELESKRLATV